MIVDFRNPSMPPTGFFSSFKGFSSSQIGLGLRVQGFFYHIIITFSFLHMVVAIALTFPSATITIALTFSLPIVAIMLQLCSHIIIILPLSFPLRIGMFCVFWPLTSHFVFIVFNVFNLHHSHEVFVTHCLWQHHDTTGLIITSSLCLLVIPLSKV